ncbi:MAG: phage tail protein [Synergistaceae bacterium]|jgi:hypothetical protein|nr:phage tail protein [Synergistaceae bacterium]
MQQLFDLYSQPEIPIFILANPDSTPLYAMGSLKDRVLNLRYNAMSTLTFTVPSIDNGTSVPYYDLIDFKRLVLVSGIGNFVITNVIKDNDGVKEAKKVTCLSLDVIFNYKKVTLFEGTYNFYDPVNPSGTLLNELLKYVPGWTLGIIDSDLIGIYRYFSVTDKTLYDFMMNEISQTYQCVFVFDTINKTISAYSTANINTPTDIYISFNNLMKSFTISQSAEELATAMTVLGSGDLAVNLVNPIGTNIIYNFDYYKTLAWMSQDLIDAINAWETKITLNQPTYANLLTDLREENATLIVLQSQLSVLNSTLQSYIATRDVRLQASQDVTAINAQITAQQSLITSKQAEITVQQAVISSIQVQLTAINTDLAFENNFTTIQLSNLDNYIIGATYTNTNFITTSLMTEVQVQNVAQELYDEGVVVLDKVAQPRYTLAIDAANFLFLQEYQPFINQLSLGCNMLVELSVGTTTNVTLLGVDFSYDNPTQFKLTLSNRLRLDDEQWKYSDLNGTTTDSGVTTNFNSNKWNYITDSYASLTSGSSTITLTSGATQTNNLAVFSNENGMIQDVNAIYTAPSPYTPEIVSEGRTFAYNFNTGYYSVIGRTVFFEANLSLSGMTGTSACPVYLQMPTYSKNIVNLNAGFKVPYAGITLAGGYTGLSGLLTPNSNLMQLYGDGSGAALAPIVGSSLNATTARIYLSGIYMVD